MGHVVYGESSMSLKLLQSAILSFQLDIALLKYF